MNAIRDERLFSGLIGAEYDLLRLICPAAAEISLKVADYVGGWRPAYPHDGPITAYEIGCGTGITSHALLSARPGLQLLAIDSEPVMLDQARANLASWLEQDRLRLEEIDALTGLQTLPTASQDVVASGYAIHNFLEPYRREVIGEIARVLKPGGVFVNGDRYALDDTQAHTRATQDEVRHYFKTFSSIGRMDLLESWIVHLFSDESEDHIMRLQPAIATLEAAGFAAIEVKYRSGVNTLLTAHKPLLASLQ